MPVVDAPSRVDSAGHRLQRVGRGLRLQERSATECFRTPLIGDSRSVNR